jgi:leucyl-tRNA synthetase
MHGPRGPARYHSMMRRYDPSEIEPKWQAVWEREQLFKAAEEDDGRPRFYKLHMFP